MTDDLEKEYKTWLNDKTDNSVNTDDNLQFIISAIWVGDVL